jgi:hypothetical protein
MQPVTGCACFGWDYGTGLYTTQIQNHFGILREMPKIPVRKQWQVQRRAMHAFLRLAGALSETLHAVSFLGLNSGQIPKQFGGGLYA